MLLLLLLLLLMLLRFVCEHIEQLLPATMTIGCCNMEVTMRMRACAIVFNGYKTHAPQHAAAAAIAADAAADTAADAAAAWDGFFGGGI